jgi:alkylated DNA repair protein alkB family protein 1
VAAVDAAAARHFEHPKGGPAPPACPKPDRCAHVCQHGLPLRLEGDAGIVNLYSAGARLPMGGHRDDMERTMDAPVLSVSLGCTAVFLLGGASRDAPPVPLILRSGDVVLLSGASRLAVHGVPRVFEGTCPPGLFAEPEGGAAGRGDGGAAAEVGGAAASDAWGHAGADAEERAAFRAFLAATRININVRQVV